MRPPSLSPSDLALLLMSSTLPVAMRPGPSPALLFSGTRTPRDVFHSAAIFPSCVEWPPGGLVHGGYARRARWLTTPRVVSFAREHEGEGLVLAGHSAGGATAVLVACLLRHEHGVDVREVHTFGAPKFASRSFREAYEGEGRKTWRHVARGDPVTRLPPWYEHVGTPRMVERQMCRLEGEGGGGGHSQNGEATSPLFLAEHRLECFLDAPGESG